MRELYGVDEAEAQWRRIDSGAKTGGLECTWSQWPQLQMDFAEQCVKPVAHLLGLSVVDRVPKTQKHQLRGHAHASVSDDLLTTWAADVALLKRYTAMMRNASSAYRQMGEALPSGRALAARRRAIARLSMSSRSSGATASPV